MPIQYLVLEFSSILSYPECVLMILGILKHPRPLLKMAT